MDAPAGTPRTLRWDTANLVAFWRWWLRALASWVPPRWRPLLGLDHGRVLLQRIGAELQVRLQQAGEVEELLQLPMPDAGGLEPVLDAVLRPQPRELPRWLLLPAAAGLRRRLELPAAAAPRLREVVGFEIERQTPFAADAVFYDARELGPAIADGRIEAELAVVPRAGVVPLLDALSEEQLAGIDLAGSDGLPLGFNLLPPAQRARRRDPLRAWHALLAAVAVLLVVALMWQLLHNRRAAADALEARVATLAAEARAASVQRQQLANLIEGQAFLDRSRQARPTSIEVIEELSRRLPDGTSLEKLAIEGERLTLIGHSSQPAALVGQLEGSPLWRSPALSGALMADARSRRDRFTMIADLVAPQPVPAAATPATPASGAVPAPVPIVEPPDAP